MLSCSLAATMRAVAADEVGGRLGSEPVAGLDRNRWPASNRNGLPTCAVIRTLYFTVFATR
jgi:hypothetical protein